MMIPVNQRRLLARAPNFNKTEAGVKALVSVLFLFSSPLPTIATSRACPEGFLGSAAPLLSDCPCFPAWHKAYRLHPPSTSRVQKFDSGSSWRRGPCCAVFRQCCRSWRAARLVSARSGLASFGRTARFARGYPPATQLHG